MHKSELELKKDQLVSSTAAISRLQDLAKVMSDSLKYTKRLVSFMVFDQDASGKQLSAEEDEMTPPQKFSIDEVSKSQDEDADNVTSGNIDKQASSNTPTRKVENFAVSFN